MIKFFTLLFALAVSASASAFDPKDKPVSVIIPFAPGGGVDQTFRHFEKFAKQKGLTLVPNHRGGAEGLIGMNEIAAAPKNGMTISFTTVAAISILKSKNPQADVEYISGIKNSVFGLFTNKDSGINNYADLKKSQRTFAHGAPAQKLFLDQIVNLHRDELKVIMVPYKGGGPVVTDVLGNHVQVGAVPFPLIKQYVDDGRLRLLGVSSERPLAGYSAPTMISLHSNWKNFDGFAVVVPVGTDQEAVRFWSNIIKEYLSDRETLSDFAKEFSEPMPFGPRHLDRLVKNTLEEIAKEK